MSILERPFVIPVTRDGLGYGFQHLGKVCVAIEHQEGSFRVSPSQVREKLIDGFEEFLWAFPNFALRNEDIAVTDANEDIGLAGCIEGFTSGLPFPLAIQL